MISSRFTHLRTIIISFVFFFLVSNAFADWTRIDDSLPAEKNRYSLLNPDQFAIFHDKLYALRGNAVYQFNGDFNKPLWSPIGDGSQDTMGVYTLLTLDNRLYAAGKSFAFYDVDGKWHSLSRIGLPADSIGKMISWNGNIVALIPVQRLNTFLFIYNVKNNAWTPLKYSFGKGTLDVLDIAISGNKLYVSGKNWDTGKPFAYVYNPALPKQPWKAVTANLPANTNGTMAVVNNTLYVGGYTENGVYVYNGNDSAPQWSQVGATTLPITDDEFTYCASARHTFRLTNINNVLYVAGVTSNCKKYVAALDQQDSGWHLVGNKVLSHDEDGLVIVGDMFSLTGFNHALYLSADHIYVLG